MSNRLRLVLREGVNLLDPFALVGATAVPGVTVVIACLVPARRATGVNVVDVLGAE